MVRTVCNSNKIINYEYRDFHQTGVRWCKCKPYLDYFTHYRYSSDVRYRAHDNFGYYGIKNAIKNTSYQYCEIVPFLSRYHKLNAWDAEKYLEVYKNHGVIEKFCKLGWFNIASHYYNVGFTEYDYGERRRFNVINEDAREMHKILGIKKDQFTELRKTDNPSYSLLKCVTENKTRKVYTIEQYTMINKLCSSSYQCEKMFNLFESLPYNKVITYLNKEENETDLYLDYIDFCRKLNWNLKNTFVAYPRYLKNAHDEAMSLIKENEKRKEIEAINRILPDIAKKYNFEFKNLMVVAPKHAKEYITESQALHNCISRNYMGSMAKGKCAIVFIRTIEEPDKPYYAMEIANGKVAQVRGFKNCLATDEVKELVTAFESKKLRAS